MIISNGSIVSINYVLKNETGNIISASSKKEPLVFKQGAGAIIFGLEKELLGKKLGDKFSVKVLAKDAYGEVNPLLFAQLKREAFAGLNNIKPGMQFQAKDKNGNSQLIRVTAVDKEKITVDKNHPLAGKTLFFEIEVLSVKVE